MNEETAQNQPAGDEGASSAYGAAESSGSQESQSEKEENFAARAGEHFREGAADAAKAVNAFMPRVRAFTEKAIYKGVYGASFGMNFTGKLVKEVVVDNVVKGARDGATAGRDAATQFRARRKAEAEETIVDVTEVDAASAPA